MGRRKSRTLTEVELEIMQIVWDQDETTVEAIHESLARTRHPLAKPSIRKMLSILQAKGYLNRHQVGRAFVYRKIVSKSEAHEGFLKNLIERAFDGSALNLVASLLDTDMVSEKELGKIKSLVARKELDRTL